MPDIDKAKQIEELNEKFQAEMKAWEDMGVEDPNMAIAFNPMQMNMWVKSLTQFLVDKGIIDEDEWIIKFKTHFIESLQEARAEIEPEMRKMRLRAAGIDLPNMSVPGSKLKRH